MLRSELEYGQSLRLVGLHGVGLNGAGLNGAGLNAILPYHPVTELVAAFSKPSGSTQQFIAEIEEK